MNVLICDKSYDTDFPEREFQIEQTLNKPEEILKEKKNVTAFFVCSSDENRIVEIIKLLRKSDFYFATPVFTNIKISLEFLTDGVFNEKEKTLEAIENINNKLELLQGNPAIIWKNKILSFLFSRPEVILKANTNVFNPIFYYHPLIEVFYEGKENYFYWLDSLSERNILKKSKLLNRIFCCPYCFSARLRFTDYCPYCNSINIRQGDFLHCFTCGLVAPQEDFLINDRLKCPRCHTQLLHIGEDYDRPLESGVCLDCGEYHIDSKLMAFCVDCEKHVETDKLNKKSIYDYSLTDIGRSQIQFNSIDVAPMLVDSINYVSPDFFFISLDWFLKMKLRYEEENFGLLGINIGFYGKVSTYEMIILLGKYLRKTLRSTDICTRLDNSYYWFILPKIDKNGLKSVELKVKDFLKNLESEITENYKINIKSFIPDKNNIKNLNARLLIAGLSSGL